MSGESWLSARLGASAGRVVYLFQLTPSSADAAAAPAVKWRADTAPDTPLQIAVSPKRVSVQSLRR
jgi:hypothetical protein